MRQPRLTTIGSHSTHILLGKRCQRVSSRSLESEYATGIHTPILSLPTVKEKRSHSNARLGGSVDAASVTSAYGKPFDDKQRKIRNLRWL
jgi:hypothetical protein